MADHEVGRVGLLGRRARREAGLTQRDYLGGGRRDAVVVADQLADRCLAAGYGDEAVRVERLEAVAPAFCVALMVAKVAAHEGPHALAAGRVLAVRVGDDLVDLRRQRAVRRDALVEVQRGDAPVGHERKAHAVKAAPHSLVARHVEGSQLTAILRRALLPEAPTALDIIRHLAWLLLAGVLLVTPHQPRRKRLQLLGRVERAVLRRNGRDFRHGCVPFILHGVALQLKEVLSYIGHVSDTHELGDLWVEQLGRRHPVQLAYLLCALRRQPAALQPLVDRLMGHADRPGEGGNASCELDRAC